MTAGPGSRSRVAPARACAFAVLERVFDHGAYADRALHSAAAALDPRDRALATQLTYGTVQRRATLDHVAQTLLDRPLAKLQPAVAHSIRLGLFQLLYLDGVAEHAAVNESVELAKRASPQGSRLVNAVLRRAAREGKGIVNSLEDDTPQHAAVKHSVPQWLAELWFAELGPDEARALLGAVNAPAEAAIRVNTLKYGAAAGGGSAVEAGGAVAAEVEGALAVEVAAALPVPTRAAPDIPEGLVLEAPFDVHGSELWLRGVIMPQSRGSMLVARALAPQPGERVLDLCAAPGGKTTHLAALMRDEGQITAVERHPGRAAALGRTCARMGATSVRVETADAGAPRADPPYDAVLVDPPCSGLGTLQSRPDLRWRANPESIAELAEFQQRILAAGARATRPGGRLVYSVCTVSQAESQAIIDRFLETHPEWTRDGEARQLLPHRDGTDGFFIARLRHR